ncbi:MAG: hypothetical protein ACYCW6_06160 [Candidatus Xenobia bacterium]
MMMKYRIFALALLGLALTGCGGGGGGGAAAPVAPTTGTLVLELPSPGARTARPRFFITPDITSFLITVTSGGQNVTGTPLTVTNTQLANENNQVTIPNVPLGTAQVTVTTQTFFGTSATTVSQSVNVTPGNNDLTVNAVLQPAFSLSDLSGTWNINLLTTAPAAGVLEEGRISGSVTFDGNGNVTSMNVEDESGLLDTPVTLTQGTFKLLDPVAGAFSVTVTGNNGNESITLTGHMDSSKDVLSVTAVQASPNLLPPGQGIGALTLTPVGPVPATVLTSSVGTTAEFLINNLATAVGATQVVPAAQFTVASNGSVAGAGGTFATTLLGLQSPAAFPDTNMTGAVAAISAGEDFLVGAAGVPLEPGLLGAVSLKPSYTLADMGGTFGFEAMFGQTAFSTPPAGTTLDGTISFDGAGNITAATLTESGQATPITATGTYSFDNTGLLAATVNLSSGGTLFIKGFLNPRDEVLMGVLNPGIGGAGTVLMVR